MQISHKAIDRPRVVMIATLLVVMCALVAALNIAVQRSPGIDQAVILVAVPYPGAQPSEAEEQITREIEDALQTLDKVDFIASTSMRGSSVTQILFLDGISPREARDDVEHLVNEIRGELPVGREIQPSINEIDFESAPIVLITLSGSDGVDERELKKIAEDVQDELETITGVANTQLFGGREREIHVDIHPDLLIQYGVSYGELRDTLRRAHVEMPAGPLSSAEFEPQVRPETQFRDVDDIQEVVIRHDEGGIVRIRDVADVKDTYRRLTNYAQLDGRNGATIVVNKEPNINMLGTARAIKERVEELKLEFPHIDFNTTRDVTVEIRYMFYTLGSSAAFGALLVLVILAWSMGFRVSVLVLVAIPLSSAVALIFLFAAGIAVSSMVIFSYILVLGMVVDGAIIVAENIHRHIERGETAEQAAKIGIDEVGLPVIAADLTTVSAFLPMLMIPGIMGDFMGVMPKVVSVALVGSVLVDHFLIPVAAKLWYGRDERIREKKKAEAAAANPNAKPAISSPLRVSPKRGRFSYLYERVLRYSLAHRWVVVSFCAMAVTWAVMMRYYNFIKRDFFPQSDRGQFEINFELPLGYSIEQTSKAAEHITKALEKIGPDGTNEMAHFVTAVGSSSGLASRLESDPAVGPEFGKVMVELTPPHLRNRRQGEIIEELRSNIPPYPGLAYRIEEVEEGPPGGFEVAVRLSGKNLEQLGALAQRLTAELGQIPGTAEIGTDYRPDSPEIVFEPRPDVVGMFDMTEADVAQAVQTAVLGDTTIVLSLDDEDVTLRVQVAPEYQRYQNDISRIMLRSPTGKLATVEELCDVRREAGLFSVNRYERRRAVIARCDVAEELGTVPDDVFKRLREDVLPEYGFRPVTGSTVEFLGTPSTLSEGVRAKFTGENEELDENMVFLMQSMAIGMILIFGILVAQFNSFRQAVVVLVAVPLSFVGVILGMWLCNFAFSLASFIGLVSLTGIVVNDAIVMVDFTNQARRRGLPVREAVVEAGVNRLRPVLLTTVTTCGGMLPLFLNITGGNEFWQPLTGAIIFGLLVATTLTLLVIPVTYSLAYWRTDRAVKA